MNFKSFQVPNNVGCDPLKPIKISIAHSPDPDDRFMFWALREGLVKHPDFVFHWQEADTQSLNHMASQNNAPDVCAISAIHYLQVHEKYQPLKMGCSVGNNYGPVIVADRQVMQLIAEGRNSSRFTVLTPGKNTTAHNVAAVLNFGLASYGEKALEHVQFEEVPIFPMQAVFERRNELVKQGIACIAILIHEGRLLYQNLGLELLLDLGKEWHARFGCSLPLGINVIARRLPKQMRQSLSQLFALSFNYGQAHKAEFIKETQKLASPYYSKLEPQDLEHYLDLYANETTGSITENDKRAFETLFRALTPGMQSEIICDWI